MSTEPSETPDSDLNPGQRLLRQVSDDLARRGILCKMLDHAWGDWQLHPKRCMEIHTCQRCGARQRRDAAHQFGPWTLLPNTCEEQRQCAHCQQIEKRPAEHQWSPWTAYGSGCEEKRVCLHCLTSEVRAGEHQWGEPKWTHDFYSGECRLISTCKRCRATLAVQERPKTLHWKLDFLGENLVAECQHCRQEVKRLPAAERLVCPTCRGDGWLRHQASAQEFLCDSCEGSGEVTARMWVELVNLEASG